MQQPERVHGKGNSVLLWLSAKRVCRGFLTEETLEAILSMFGDRIGRLLFKQTVEHNVMNHILASDTDIDAATYQKMRGMSYQEVVQTHGQISFPEVLRKEKAL